MDPALIAKLQAALQSPAFKGGTAMMGGANPMQAAQAMQPPPQQQAKPQQGGMPGMGFLQMLMNGQGQGAINPQQLAGLFAPKL